MSWNQIYLTAHGEWKSSSAHYGETAQMGLRLTAHPGDSLPEKGSIYTPPAWAAVGPVTDSYSGTNGELTQMFSATVGTAPADEEIDGETQADLAEDFRTFLNAVKTYTSAGFNWTHFKIAPIAPDGSYAAPSSVYTLNTPLAGTGTESSQLPPECALAVSLRAPILGRRGRGRMYLPALGSGIITAGLVSGTPSGVIRAAAATLVADLQNSPGIDWVNRFVVTVTSAGAATAVRPTEIRLGNRVDVQRRRQEQIDEVYTSTAL